MSLHDLQDFDAIFFRLSRFFLSGNSSASKKKATARLESIQRYSISYVVKSVC